MADGGEGKRWEKHEIPRSSNNLPFSLPPVLDFLPVADILTNLAPLVTLSFLPLKREWGEKICQSLNSFATDRVSHGHPPNIVFVNG